MNTEQNNVNHQLLGRACSAYLADNPTSITTTALHNLLEVPQHADRVLRHDWSRMNEHEIAGDYLARIKWDDMKPSTIARGLFWLAFYQQRASQEQQ